MNVEEAPRGAKTEEENMMADRLMDANEMLCLVIGLEELRFQSSVTYSLTRWKYAFIVLYFITSHIILSLFG